MKKWTLTRVMLAFVLVLLMSPYLIPVHLISLIHLIASILGKALLKIEYYIRGYQRMLLYPASRIYLFVMDKCGYRE